MIKKFFHFLLVAVTGTVWSGLLVVIFRLFFRLIYHVNILSPDFYKMIANYWDNGGVIQQKDLILLIGIFMYFPLCFYGWYRINHFKFIKLLIIPLNKLAYMGIDKYMASARSVNIKNLKIEEKKTLEQIVQERLEVENKKVKTPDSADFRQKIVEKLEEELK